MTDETCVEGHKLAIIRFCPVCRGRAGGSRSTPAKRRAIKKAAKARRKRSG